jgi:hypothetical protein
LGVETGTDESGGRGVRMSDDYHSDYSRLSNSMLSVLKRSPEEFERRFILRNLTTEPSESMNLGSLVHCLSLEPYRYNDLFAIEPAGDGRTAAVKKARAEFAATVGNKTIVTQKDRDKALACASKLLQHDQIGELLAHAASFDARIEQPLAFSIEGTPCKAKPDWLSVPKRLILDVKTTQDASPESFAKSIASFGYHRQAAMYLHAAEEVFGHVREWRFLFAVVSTKEPHEVACYELGKSDIDRGGEEILLLIDDYEQRKAKNNWKAAWSSGVVPLSLPRWYRGTVLTMEEEVTSDNNDY